MFGGGGQSRSQARYRGQDYNAEMKINLSDAYSTSQETITVNGKNKRVTNPDGIENGQKLKLKGFGGEGRNGGPAGDLIITFSIINNTNFRRDGNDLFLNVDTDLFTAVLGGEITIDTMSGKVKLKVAPETQNGTKIRLKGKGFPVYKKENTYGDLYVTYNIKIPTGLTEKQKELFKELSKL